MKALPAPDTPTLVPALITLDRYHHMIASGALADWRVELLNGVLVEMPSEGAVHAGLTTKTRDYLMQQLGDRAQIREGHPLSIPLSNSEPEPDLANQSRSI
jgi:Uma2 family endonuclease